MATYVMSDIHGQKKMFDKMLKKINFTDKDRLYILGDVIDRGPDGIKMLLKVMRTPNMFMVKGNHELMMKTTFFLMDVESYLIWANNGSSTTIEQWKKYADSTKGKILNFITGLPVEYKVELDGKQYILCHSSPLPEEYDDDPADKPTIMYRYSTDEEFCVWDRHFLFTRDKAFENKTVIFGHSPVFNYSQERPCKILKMNDVIDKDYPGKVVNGTFINIDCGCAAIPYDKKKEYGSRLGCLRLDDMKEFYIDPEV